MFVVAFTQIVVIFYEILHCSTQFSQFYKQVGIVDQVRVYMYSVSIDVSPPKVTKPTSSSIVLVDPI